MIVRATALGVFEVLWAVAVRAGAVGAMTGAEASCPVPARTRDRSKMSAVVVLRRCFEFVLLYLPPATSCTVPMERA